MTKNENDVKVLESIIETQNARGAALPTDLDHKRYKWDENGRLIKLSLSVCGLRKNLSLEGLDALEFLNCSFNQLTELDIKSNPALKALICDRNQLALDVSANPALKRLDCRNNQLTQLDISGNPKLEILNCSFNHLGSLDISTNPALKRLDCRGNKIEALDVGKNPVLSRLFCNHSITVIDLEEECMETEEEGDHPANMELDT